MLVTISSPRNEQLCEYNTRLTAHPTETPYLWKAIVSIIYSKIMRELCIQREIFNYPIRYYFGFTFKNTRLL